MKLQRWSRERIGTSAVLGAAGERCPQEILTTAVSPPQGDRRAASSSTRQELGWRDTETLKSYERFH
ncbi:hypothetical protein TNIN_264761 [Trichonephila inaurata madagascariensis]|uniref:Uncharacterized protein n=1 Tax=Trichonephila inaurata madagascariensis TaxID=2747483 RepID=A0A8X6WXV7_9ARAC|nr:hypothetical protein TNIN_264761 [Trichonephila inaurata madagascariensis]